MASRPALLYTFAERVLPRAGILRRSSGRVARTAGSGTPGDWGDGDETLPMDGVLRHVWDELLDTDLPTSTTKPAAWQRWALNHQLPGVRVTPDELEGPWERAHGAWTALDGDLSRTLLRSCRKGTADVRGGAPTAAYGPPPGP